MRGHKSYSLKTLYVIEHIYESCKISVLITFVGIYILPQQSYLLNSVGNESSDLIYYVKRFAASLPASRIRDYTVCAEVVAAVHNVDKCLVPVKALCRQSLYYFSAVLPDVHNLLLLIHYIFEKLREHMYVVRSKYYIHPRIFHLERIYNVLLLHHTAAYSNHKFRVLSFFLFELSQRAEKSLVCVFSDTACIYDYYVCFFFI